MRLGGLDGGVRTLRGAARQFSSVVEQRFCKTKQGNSRFFKFRKFPFGMILIQLEICFLGSRGHLRELSTSRNCHAVQFASRSEELKIKQKIARTNFN